MFVLLSTTQYNLGRAFYPSPVFTASKMNARRLCYELADCIAWFHDELYYFTPCPALKISLLSSGEGKKRPKKTIFLAVVVACPLPRRILKSTVCGMAACLSGRDNVLVNLSRLLVSPLFCQMSKPSQRWVNLLTQILPIIHDPDTYWARNYSM